MLSNYVLFFSLNLLPFHYLLLDYPDRPFFAKNHSRPSCITSTDLLSPSKTDHAHCSFPGASSSIYLASLSLWPSLYRSTFTPLEPSPSLSVTRNLGCPSSFATAGLVFHEPPFNRYASFGVFLFAMI